MVLHSSAFCYKRANSKIKAVRPQGLLGWHCVLEKRCSLSVPQPRFDVNTVKKVHSVSILNWFNWRAFYKKTENFTELDGEFWSKFCLFFILRQLEKFTVCQYIFSFHKNRLQTNNENGNTTAQELIALLIHLWLLLVLALLGFSYSMNVRTFSLKIFKNWDRCEFCQVIFFVNRILNRKTTLTRN